MEKNKSSKDSLPWFKSQEVAINCVSWSNSGPHLINGDNKSQFHLCRTVVKGLIQFMWITYNAYQIISDDSCLDHKFRKSRTNFISFASPWYIRNFIERHHHLLGHCRYNELFLTFFLSFTFNLKFVWSPISALTNFLAFI